MYTVTKDGQTYDEVIAAIDAVQFNDNLTGVSFYLYPDEFPMYPGDPSYDTMYYESGMAKPPLQTFLDAEAAYVQAQKDETTAWFDETQRVSDLTDRWNAISDISLAVNLAGETEPNNQIIFRDIIDNNNEARLSALEAQSATAQALVTEAEAIQDKEKRVAHGVKTIAYISYRHSLKSPTEADVVAMLSDATVQSISSLLSTGSLDTARTLVAGIDLTPFLLDESDRTAILAKIDEY